MPIGDRFPARNLVPLLGPIGDRRHGAGREPGTEVHADLAQGLPDVGGMFAHQTSGRPAVVLVVDDDPAVLGMMARALLSAGYAVHRARSGPEALALAEQLARPLDLVVTDLRMDPLGGAELAELLYSRGLASHFLFVSGYGPAEKYNEELGPFLTKPFSPEKLLERVASVLG